MRSSVLLIYTGGTIGMKTDAQSGALIPFDFNSIYEEFPSLKGLNIDIDILSINPVIDSSNVSPKNWIDIATIIKENYARYDGFVVLHGTDTMSYTASAISFMLENLSKPVVFTGSQIPIGILRTDGHENLITAIEIAGSKVANRALVPEVCLYFQNKLFRANRTTKQSAEALNAFRSDNYPPLAEVGVNISYNTPYIYKPTTYPEELIVASELETKVVIVKLFPGIDESVFNAILSVKDLRAIVLETFGSGNAPTNKWFIEAIKRAIDSGVLILNTTQCSNGQVSMSLYETGLKLQKAGVLCGYDMTTEAAITKLMYILGKNITAKERIKLLTQSLKGEFTR